MSQGREDKCLRSLVMSGDRSPAGMISAAVIDSLPSGAEIDRRAHTQTCTACTVLNCVGGEVN